MGRKTPTLVEITEPVTVTAEKHPVFYRRLAVVLRLLSRKDLCR